MMNAMTAYTAAYAQDACAAFVRPSSADSFIMVITLDVSLLASISIIILLALLVLVLLRHAYQRTRSLPSARPCRPDGTRIKRLRRTGEASFL